MLDWRSKLRLDERGTLASRFSVKEFSQDTWPDFESLFGKHNGVRGGCWCTFHLCTSAQYDQMTKQGHEEKLKALAYQGHGSEIPELDTHNIRVLKKCIKKEGFQTVALLGKSMKLIRLVI